MCMFGFYFNGMKILGSPCRLAILKYCVVHCTIWFIIFITELWIFNVYDYIVYSVVFACVKGKSLLLCTHKTEYL